jgi:hypothetical protein
MTVQLKKMVATGAFALFAVALVAAEAAPSQTMQRSEWLAKVGECAKSADAMSDVMSKLSPADQVALISEVNSAIDKMPGSKEQKAAAYVNANMAGLKAAMAQNKDKKAANDVLAEIYATVPPEMLTELGERLAKGPLNRGTMDQATFITISTNALHTINSRCEKAENAGVRETLAAVAFLLASNEKNPSQDLINTMLSQMGDSKTRDLAANEWIKPALGIGGDQTYDPMLGAANAGEEPDSAVVDSILGEPGLPPAVQHTGGNDVTVAMLGELTTGSDTPAGRMGAGAFEAPTIAGVGPNELPSDIGLNRVPRGYMSGKSENGEYNPYYTRNRGDKPGSGGYDGQGLSAW